MTKNYESLPTEPDWNGKPTKKDVRLYTNDTKPTPLCISHVVARRANAITVELMSDKVKSGGCVDCPAIDVS